MGIVKKEKLFNKETLVRVLSALALMGIACGSVFLPSHIFFLFLILPLSTLAGREWIGLCFPKWSKEKKDIVTGIVIVLAMGFVWAKSWSGYEKIVLSCAVITILVNLVYYQIRSKDIKPFFNQPGSKIKVKIYVIGLFLSGFITQVAAWKSAMILHESGNIDLLYFLVLVSAADSAGYVFGKYIVSPANIFTMSPNKTWSGTAAMLIIPAVVGLILPERMALWSLVLGGVALAGDLWVSLIKRLSGQKDTGSIIPGHGGVLDRLDSHIMALSILGFY